MRALGPNWPRDSSDAAWRSAIFSFTMSPEPMRRMGYLKNITR